MQIKVNGETRAFDAPLTVAQLTEALALEGGRVAVERNRQIVSRSAYGSTALCEGDEIEIVQFIGGG